MKTIESLTICQPGGIYPDPHLWIEPRSLLSIRFAAFEGLVKYAADLSIVPALAESWTVSEDAKTWTFTIRKNVKFHDGTLLTAQDAMASIKNASRSDVPGAYGTDALLFSYLGDAQTHCIDEFQLQIILPSPLADLPDLLAYIMIIPERFLGKNPLSIPGTGPFKPENILEKRYEFSRFSEYWGPKIPVEKLIFLDERDPQKRMQFFKDGKADVITTLKKSQAEFFSNDSQAVIVPHEIPLSIPLFLNCFEGPFADRRVRQAINYGTDVIEIIEKIYDGDANRLSGPLSKFHFGVDPDYPPYPYNPIKARELIKSAGYENGLTLKLLIPATGPDESPAIAACLVEQWKKIDVIVDIQTQENREQYALDVRDKKIRDFCIFDSSPLSSYRVLLEKLDSDKKGPWWQGYSNELFNEALKFAAKTTDHEKRAAYYRQALRIASEDAAWLYLLTPNEAFVIRKSVYDVLPDLCKRIDGIVFLN